MLSMSKKTISKTMNNNNENDNNYCRYCLKNIKLKVVLVSIAVILFSRTVFVDSNYFSSWATTTTTTTTTDATTTTTTRGTTTATTRMPPSPPTLTLPINATETMTTSSSTRIEAVAASPGGAAAAACDSQWETFAPDQPLRGTQVIIRNNNNSSYLRYTSNKTSSSQLLQLLPNQLFVHPPSNFAFCRIPKNGCSQWSMVFNKILKDDPSQSSIHYNIDKASQQYFIKQKGQAGQVQRLLQDPAAMRVIFVRDPLARFASAFLNKCFASNCGNTYCRPIRKFYFNKTKPQNGHVLPFRAALAWILHEKTDPRRINNHWALQSSQCGLLQKGNGGEGNHSSFSLQHAQEDALHSLYNIIGLVDKTTMSREATCIMEKAGLSRYNRRGGSNATQPFWVPHSEMTIAGEGHYRKDDESELLKRLYTTDLARQFMNKFRADYELFHLPEPDWVPHATGEWLDRLDHHPCYNKSTA